MRVSSQYDNSIASPVPRQRHLDGSEIYFRAAGILPAAGAGDARKLKRFGACSASDAGISKKDGEIK